MKISGVEKSFNREKQRDKKHYYGGSKKASDKSTWEDELKNAISRQAGKSK